MGSKTGCCSGAEPKEETEAGCGCGCGCESEIKQEPWMTSLVTTPAGDVPKVATKLSFADVWGSWKARWGIGRMDYTVEPGLYCVGKPDAASPVLVTANYKMTFDRLRMELSGVSAWIMVLDTDGINVWCSAGKGTFGTEEIVRRIEETGLKDVVNHRTLILPQLAAPGVQAHEVKKLTGFRVVYGPVRASDIKAFLAADMKATKAMREVRFTMWDRLVLTPIELVEALKPSLILFGVLFLLNAIGLGHYGFVDLCAWLGAIFAGAVLTPVLLPFIPGRAFSFKGMLLGILWAVGVWLLNGFPGVPSFSWLKAAAYLLALPAVSAYCAMNFTGASTFTSLSGVDREMKFALPAMILAAAVAVVLLLVNDFILVFG